MENVLPNIIKNINKNKKNIEEAIKNDGENFKLNYELVDYIIYKFESLKDSVKTKKYTEKIYVTNGNPYTTLILGLTAVLFNKKIMINVLNNMTNLNKELVKCLKDVQIKDSFKLVDNMNVLDLTETIKRINSKIVVIDDRSIYTYLFNENFPVMYMPFFSLDLYYNSNEYQEMVDVIELYASTNFINLRILKEDNPKRVVILSKKKESANAILELTKDVEEFDKTLPLINRNNDIYKKIYLNFNPFDEFEKDMIDFII